MSARAFVPGPRVKYQNSPSSFFLSSTIFSLGFSSSHVLELKTEKKCFHGEWKDCGGHARHSSVNVLFTAGLSFILIFMLPLQTTKSHSLYYESNVQHQWIIHYEPISGRGSWRALFQSRLTTLQGRGSYCHFRAQETEVKRLNHLLEATRLLNVTKLFELILELFLFKAHHFGLLFLAMKDKAFLYHFHTINN